MSDDAPKNAFELAMQRLRQKDKEAGVDARPLTDAQKTAVAEVRQVYKAKTAEAEILRAAARDVEVVGRRDWSSSASPYRLTPCGMRMTIKVRGAQRAGSASRSSWI